MKTKILITILILVILLQTAVIAVQAKAPRYLLQPGEAVVVYCPTFMGFHVKDADSWWNEIKLKCFVL